MDPIILANCYYIYLCMAPLGIINRISSACSIIHILTTNRRRPIGK